jgi:hypothetical protein
MAVKLFLLAALSCPPIIQENQTELSWGEKDKAIADQYRSRCGDVFPEAPCVAMIIKREKQVYWVICGAEKSVKDRLL